MGRLLVPPPVRAASCVTCCSETLAISDITCHLTPSVYGGVVREPV